MRPKNFGAAKLEKPVADNHVLRISPSQTSTVGSHRVCQREEYFDTSGRQGK